VKPLTVTAARSSTSAPQAVATIKLRDFSFVIPPKLAGQGVIAVKNEGAQSHEMAIYQLNPGKTIADARSFLAAPPGTPPPTPAPGTFVGGITGLAPGATGYIDLHLRSNRNYVAVCFFPDPTKSGLPHLLEGMIQQFGVQ
jgi:hypothetical protein